MLFFISISHWNIKHLECVRQKEKETNDEATSSQMTYTAFFSIDYDFEVNFFFQFIHRKKATYVVEVSFYINVYVMLDGCV